MPNLMFYLACKVGLHTGNWVFDSAGRCNMTQICRSCGNRDNSVNHNVQVWNKPPSESEASGVCLRCNRWLIRGKTTGFERR